MRKGNWISVVAVTVLMTALALAGCGGGNDNGGGGGGPTPIKPTFLVTDTTGTVVVGATVYAIPATDVAALAATSLDSTVTATSGNYSAAAQAADEPVEDLISANSGTYLSAVTDSTGKAVFADNLAASDTFFIAVKPGTADHLPGGSKCRDAVTGSSLNNATTAIEVSTTPSSSATFVGTSACLGCHAGYATVNQTMHKL